MSACVSVGRSAWVSVHVEARVHVRLGACVCVRLDCVCGARACFLVRLGACVCVPAHTCSSMVPVALFSRATARVWVMPSAGVPQMLTIRSPVFDLVGSGEKR